MLVYSCSFFYYLGASLRISGVQTSKGGQPQYTVVTVAQPKLMSSNQLNIGQVISDALLIQLMINIIVCV